MSRKIFEWSALAMMASIVGFASMWAVLYALNVIYTPSSSRIEKLQDRFPHRVAYEEIR